MGVLDNARFAHAQGQGVSIALAELIEFADEQAERIVQLESQVGLKRKDDRKAAFRRAFDVTYQAAAVAMTLYDNFPAAVSVERLQSSMYDAHQDSASLAVVRQRIWRLRKVLEPEAIISFPGHGYSLTPAGHEAIAKGLGL
jgi:hypothetical protein